MLFSKISGLVRFSYHVNIEAPGLGGDTAAVAGLYGPGSIAAGPDNCKTF